MALRPDTAGQRRLGEPHTAAFGLSDDAPGRVDELTVGSLTALAALWRLAGRVVTGAAVWRRVGLACPWPARWVAVQADP